MATSPKDSGGSGMKIPKLDVLEGTDGGNNLGEGNSAEATTGTAPKKNLPWFSLKFTCENGSFPELVDKLLQVVGGGEEDLSANQFFATMVHVCMIESGFIPLVENQQLVGVDNLLKLKLKDRMAVCLKDLITALSDGDLCNRTYAFLVEKKEDCEVDGDMQCSSSRQPGYMYSPFRVAMNLVQDQVGLIVMLQSYEHRRQFVVRPRRIAPYPFNGGSMSLCYKPKEDFLKDGTFKSMEFVDYIKGHIYEFLDSCAGVCPEVRGFGDLPNELMEIITKGLDIRSYVRFMTTNHRHYELLNKDNLWSHALKRIQTDIRNYGLIPIDTSEEDWNNPKAGCERVYRRSLEAHERVQARRRRSGLIRIPLRRSPTFGDGSPRFMR